MGAVEHARVIKVMGAYLATLLAAPSLQAQEAVQTVAEPAVFTDCLDNGIGGGACPTEKLAKNLGLLDSEDVRPLSAYGIESFAVLTSLRYAASALFFLDEGEPCIADEERTAALEIWSRWVTKPDDLPSGLSSTFDVYAELMDGIGKIEVVC